MKNTDFEIDYADLEHNPVEKKPYNRKAGRREQIKIVKTNKGLFSDTCGKMRYQTLKRAISKKKAIEKHIVEKKEDKILRIYKCPVCHYFHLTHQPQGRGKTVRK